MIKRAKNGGAQRRRFLDCREKPEGEGVQTPLPGPAPVKGNSSASISNFVVNLEVISSLKMPGLIFNYILSYSYTTILKGFLHLNK